MDEATLTVSRNDYDLLDELGKANGWSAKEAGHRAIHAILALDRHLQDLQDRQQADVRTLIGRLRRELAPRFLLRPIPMRKVEAVEDKPVAVCIDDLMFYELDGLLIASRIVTTRRENPDDGDEDTFELYQVRDGQLVLLRSDPYSGCRDPGGVPLT